MPNAIKFHRTFYEGGNAKYEAGKAYPVTEETMRQVALGHAEEVNVEANEPAPEAEAAPETEARKAAKGLKR